MYFGAVKFNVILCDIITCKYQRTIIRREIELNGVIKITESGTRVDYHGRFVSGRVKYRANCPENCLGWVFDNERGDTVQ